MDARAPLAKAVMDARGPTTLLLLLWRSLLLTPTMLLLLRLWRS